MASIHSKLAQSASMGIWRNQIITYRDYLNRVLLGLVHASHRDYSAGVGKLIEHPEFRRFCNELHENLYDSLNRYMAGEDVAVLERELFPASGILEEKPMEAEVAFKAITRLYTQYIAAEALSSDPFKADSLQYKSLIQAATTLPTSTRVVERAAFQDALLSVDQDSALLYRTKFQHFNHLLGGGLRARRLYTVGGAPGVGKSIYLLNMFIDACLNGVPAVYLSLENSVEETQRRLIAHLAEYDLGNLYFDRPGVREEVVGKLDAVKDQIEKLNKYGTIIEMGGVTLQEIHSILVEKEPGVFLLDYLNLVDHNVYGNKPKDLEDLTTQLARASKQHNNAIVTACQLNRDAISAKDPDETTVGESWGIVKSSDMFATLYHHRINEKTKEQDEEHFPEACDVTKVMYYSIVKSRFTPTGKIPMYAHKEYVKLVSL